LESTTDAPALEFAGFWRRLGAFIIDALIVGAVVGIITSAFFPLHWLQAEGHGVLSFIRDMVQNAIASVRTSPILSASGAGEGRRPARYCSTSASFALTAPITHWVTPCYAILAI
jgi:hypothetical protein